VAFADRVPDWVKRHVPTQESVQRNRLLRPFARPLSNPALWRLHRRSVPRAVAVGLGVGVIIPFMHTIIAALLAIPARANVAVAAAVTLLINPLTIPPLYYAAYHVGKWELRHDKGVVDQETARQFTSELGRILFWIHHGAGPMALGVVNIAIAAALVGYGVATVLWRLWLASKWRHRRHSRRAVSR
jgi:uncharacterized protein (DUF2062 family)